MIKDFNDLSDFLEINPKQLGAMLWANESFYREHKIPKRRSGFRQLSIPIDPLKDVQRRIKAAFLDGYLPQDCVHAYTAGRSILSNATTHAGKRFLYKLDLSQFFDNIALEDVINAFESIRVSRSTFATPNCTIFSNKVSDYLARLCTHKGSLPQGAPTSPSLSNIVADRLDTTLLDYCAAHQLCYTRYADDLVFSSNKAITHPVRREINVLIEDHGFRVNIYKLAYILPKENKIVTGLLLSDSHVRLPKKRRREIRAEVHRFLSSIPNGQAPDAETHLKAKRRLLGRLGYWRMVEPECEFALTAMNRLLRDDR